MKKNTKPRRITEYQLRKALYKDYLTQIQIADKYRVTTATVHGTAKRHDIDLKYAIVSARLPDFIKHKIDEEAITRGLSNKELVSRLLRAIVKDELYSALLDN